MEPYDEGGQVLFSLTSNKMVHDLNTTMIAEVPSAFRSPDEPIFQLASVSFSNSNIAGYEWPANNFLRKLQLHRNPSKLLNLNNLGTETETSQGASNLSMHEFSYQCLDTRSSLSKLNDPEEDLHKSKKKALLPTPPPDSAILPITQGMLPIHTRTHPEIQFDNETFTPKPYKNSRNLGTQNNNIISNSGSRSMYRGGINRPMYGNRPVYGNANRMRRPPRGGKYRGNNRMCSNFSVKKRFNNNSNEF